MKKYKKTIRQAVFKTVSFFLLAMVLLIGKLHAQQKQLSGTVLDAKNEVVIGANVIVKGTNKGTITNASGKFNLEVALPATIQVSFLGYTTKEVDVTESGPLQIILQDDVQTLDELVVIGYGVQKKKDLTGAVAVVDSKTLKDKSATTLAEALQGAVAGVYVRGGSRPGQETQIEVRGVKSLTNNSPLYVIDGLITSGGRDLNVADIESIQILKDASAAAIYGSRAANGVILITTKKGKEGPLKVDVSFRGTVQATPQYDLATRDEFIRINDMAYANAGLPAQSHRQDVNTDWQDEVFRTGQVYDANLTLSGGGKNSNFLISLGYFDNKGTVIGTDFDRISLRINTEAQKGIFKIGENLQISNTSSGEGPSMNPYWEVLRMLPTIPVYDEANPGGYGYGDGYSAKTFGTNLVAMNDLEKRTNENLRLRGNLFAELTLLKSFTYRTSLGYETSFDNYQYLRKVGNWTYNQPGVQSKYHENRARYQSLIFENTLTFDQNFGKHHVNALAGITYQDDNSRIMGGEKQNILQKPNGDYFTEIDAGASDPAVFGSGEASTLISYLGRVNYNYDDRYLLTGTIRTDGSSRFSKENRWGVFPSISAGWRISKESFFQVNWIDDLKIRANYGTLGSVNIGSYDYLPLMNYYNPTIFNNVLVNGATQVKLANQNLKWETLVQQNYGIDVSLFKNRLSASIEYYISNSKDVLYGMPIAASTGNDGGEPVVNAASLCNRGFELTTIWRDRVRSVNYNIGLNLTTISNKIKGLGYGETKVVTQTTLSTLGEPIGMWYLIKTDGLFQNEAEIQAHKNSKGQVIQPTARPGDVRFMDENDDGIINNEDRQVVGSPWAKVEAGVNLGLEWKGLDFNMLWFTSLGSKIFNSPRQLTDRFDDNSNYRKGIKPWEKEGDTGMPRAVYASTTNSLIETDRWLENGSFLRLKEVSIGYSLPKSFLKKLYIESCRFNITGQNLLTITGYSGLDPELSGSLYERGRDFASFPNARAFSAGINISF